MNNLVRSALIVANGDLPNADIVQQEVDAASFVLAADGGANQLIALGFAPDAVLGDMDSLQTELPDSVQIIDAPEQSFTDLEKSVQYLKSEGYEAITLIGATGNRLDHTFGTLAVVVRHNVRLVDNIGTAVSIRGPGQLGIAANEGQIISLMPMGLVPD